LFCTGADAATRDAQSRSGFALPATGGAAIVAARAGAKPEPFVIDRPIGATKAANWAGANTVRARVDTGPGSGWKKIK
jgi:hypothetical protein